MFVASHTNSTPALTPLLVEENLKADRYDGKWKGQGTRDRKRAAIHRAEKVFKRAGGFPSQGDVPGSRPELEFSRPVAFIPMISHARPASRTPITQGNG